MAEQLTSNQEREIQKVEIKYNKRKKLLDKLAILPLMIFVGGGSIGSTLSLLPNPYTNQNTSLYGQLQNKKSRIEESREYLKKEMDIIPSNENLPYQPEELKNSIERVFADPSRINSLERLAQQYQSHLEQANEQIEELRKSQNVEKYFNYKNIANKLVHSAGIALLSFFPFMFLYNNFKYIRKRKINRIRNQN